MCHKAAALWMEGIAHGSNAADADSPCLQHRCLPAGCTCLYICTPHSCSGTLGIHSHCCLYKLPLALGCSWSLGVVEGVVGTCGIEASYSCTLFWCLQSITMNNYSKDAITRGQRSSLLKEQSLTDWTSIFQHPLALSVNPDSCNDNHISCNKSPPYLMTIKPLTTCL